MSGQKRFTTKLLDKCVNRCYNKSADGRQTKGEKAMKNKTKITLKGIENLEKEIFGDVTVVPFISPEIVAAIESEERAHDNGSAL